MLGTMLETLNSRHCPQPVRSNKNTRVIQSTMRFLSWRNAGDPLCTMLQAKELALGTLDISGEPCVNVRLSVAATLIVSNMLLAILHASRNAVLSSQ